ncbi:hypothetical protein FRC07_008531 [Ceratobasidium sp. 392]|nr:hypothetical protein FRC07_008531 [Ceratobasidium sp. 392]
MELPNVPYVAASMAQLEVMVNYLAMLRGKMKEHIPPLITSSHGFEHRAVTPEAIQGNLDRFHKIYPNSFHCMSTRPCKGHYEHPNIGHCIAASLFYGPNLPGVLFPDYLENMPLTIVAFILALMQFCIKEWSDGYFVSYNLGTSKMLYKYKAHLAGLKDLHNFAPRQMQCLQDEWFSYASPRMPTPAPPVTHSNFNLFFNYQPNKTNAIPHPDNLRSPSPVELNKYGCVTTASNGKGQVMD